MTLISWNLLTGLYYYYYIAQSISRDISPSSSCHIIIRKCNGCMDRVVVSAFPPKCYKTSSCHIIIRKCNDCVDRVVESAFPLKCYKTGTSGTDREGREGGVHRYKLNLGMPVWAVCPSHYTGYGYASRAARSNSWIQAVIVNRTHHVSIDRQLQRSLIGVSRA